MMMALLLPCCSFALPTIHHHQQQQRLPSYCYYQPTTTTTTVPFSYGCSRWKNTNNCCCSHFPQLWRGYQPRRRTNTIPRIHRCRVSCCSSSYHQILGVEPNADWDTIKRAYRKKALECHPDVCKDPDAKEKFVRILHAYQMLSQQRKKQQATTTCQNNTSDTKTAQDFMKEWRRRNPYPEDLNDDLSRLWKDIVDGAKKAAKEWNNNNMSYTHDRNKKKKNGKMGVSLLDDLASFIQDQWVGLSSKEQEEDFEAVIASGNIQLLKKEMEYRRELVDTLRKRWEATQAVVQAKKRVLECLQQQINSSWSSPPHILEALEEQLDIARSEMDAWKEKLDQIQQQRQRQVGKLEQLELQYRNMESQSNPPSPPPRSEVDEELRQMKRQMGITPLQE
ncbi:hypothetical protein GAYE_SCF67G6885 [Galdieria yellowstonensis]|uniref:J domain-containing protein n=1 Tax=Galdieria yellowstonensis TaxID=3028027 RepID=A0AAV9IP61_9RHOD|nr:hypothetical protein GAYE_SCF67G6885 [Galdieria yellowstonensis]